MLPIGMSIGYYRIVVEGELGSRCISAFDGLDLHAASGKPSSEPSRIELITVSVEPRPAHWR